MFPEKTCILVDGAITEYHIANEDKYKDLNYRLFSINDIEDIIKVYPRRRVAGILAFLKNMIDGRAQILTKHENIDRRAKNFGSTQHPRVSLGRFEGEIEKPVPRHFL